MIPKAAFISISDMYGAGANVLKNALGDGDIAGDNFDNTAAGAGYLAKAMIALLDPEVIEDLNTGADSTFHRLMADPRAYDQMNAILKCLSRHCDGITEYIESFFGTENEFRACPEFNTVHRVALGVYLRKLCVFSPAIGSYDGDDDPLDDGMGKYVAPSNGEEVFTPGEAIKNDLYAPGHLKAEVMVAIGPNADLVATIHLLDIDGVAKTKVVTLTKESAEGTQFDIGSAGDKYYSVTDITATGGQPGDTFRVIVERERELPAIEVPMM